MCAIYIDQLLLLFLLLLLLFFSCFVHYICSYFPVVGSFSWVFLNVQLELFQLLFWTLKSNNSSLSFLARKSIACVVFSETIAYANCTEAYTSLYGLYTNEGGAGHLNNHLELFHVHIMYTGLIRSTAREITWKMNIRTFWLQKSVSHFVQSWN